MYNMVDVQSASSNFLPLCGVADQVNEKWIIPSIMLCINSTVLVHHDVTLFFLNSLKHLIFGLMRQLFIYIG